MSVALDQTSERDASAGVASRPALRVLTCGSVDDGKSTLIGRLLYDQNQLFDDHLASLKRESLMCGTAEAELEFALLLDGLEAEREQGITIDVAHRYFSTPRRAFVVSDTPGHEQYTRNMATGASNSDVAVLLVDARKGLLAQTRRHAIIVDLLGIRRVVLAINKMDLVEFAHEAFERIVDQFRQFAAALRFKSIVSIPLSARYGDNVSNLSRRTSWYSGPTLIECLETLDVEEDRTAKPFRMPVQLVIRPHLDFRGFAGTIASGTLRAGDDIAVLPSGQSSRVKAIELSGGPVSSASTGDAVTVTLIDELDIARGDLLAAITDRPHVADQFAAHVIWMGNDELLPGRAYLIKIGHAVLPASVTELKHRVDIDTLSPIAAKTLTMNEVGICNVSVSRPIAFDSYRDNHTTGGFILIDRYSNETVGAGTIDFPLRRATNIHHHKSVISRAERSRLKHQKPVVVWFTGLSGAGKSTIANLVEADLHLLGLHTMMLDGDNIRHGLSKDLGFTQADRVENIRRIGEVAKLMTDAGLIVLCSFISPFRAERRLVREMLAEQEFLEIFVDTPIGECIARDPKGLYRRALAGEIKNFTGISQVYEPPDNPELHLNTAQNSAAALADEVIRELTRRGIF
jgi:bifunctional enzyme CysN/CysC